MKYQVTINGTSPEMQDLSTQINGAFTQIRTDMKTPQFVRADLPTDGSERVAIVTDDSPVSFNFWDGAAWQKVLV